MTHRLIYLILLVLSVCLNISIQAQQFVDNDIENYSPKFEYTESKKENKVEYNWVPSARINFLLDSIYEMNRKIKKMEGYRILAYSGNDKDAANKVKERLYELFPNADVYQEYKQPIYRVKLGDFSDRLEAKRIMMKIVIKEFPKSIVIADNVLIKRN